MVNGKTNKLGLKSDSDLAAKTIEWEKEVSEVM
jgi:hypothetical protein